ncbi:MAG TPA: cbb3-type cytochrome c oxidase N-terminal domain-containing protein [Bacteroidia bacterium]|nr:cbb3-type cytochrome c oxidase N-terminal domain-containing protein [Bacteroidia bacterium]
MKTKKISLTSSAVLINAGLIMAQEANNANGVISQTSNNSVIGWGLIILLIIQLFVIRSMSNAIRSVGNSDAFTQNKNKVLNVLLLIGLFFTSSIYAQNNNLDNEPLVNFSDAQINFLIFLNLLLSIIVIWMYSQFQKMLQYAGLVKKEEQKSSLWNIEHLLTKAVPVEKEAAIQFEHEYDGIRELDNVLPPWWVWMFYTTIIFSVVYLIHYHISPIKALEKIGFVGPGVGQEELYKMEMEQAEKEKQAYLAQMANKVNEENVTALTDENEIKQGKEVYMTNCVTCHGKEAQGGAGPNLTDDYWLHGGGIKNIFKTIKYGVPEKGMIAWESQLSPKQIQQVASFILTLRGTNPPGAKEPQGELWKEEGSSATNQKQDSTATK